MGTPSEQQRSARPIMVQGFSLDGKPHVLKQWLSADVVVLVNQGARYLDTIALLRQIADELEADPIPDELERPR